MLRTGASRLDRSQGCVRVNMTGAGAITQLAYGVFHVAVLGMRVALVTVGMAARAIGLIGRTSPTCRIGIRRVAIQTGECDTVSAWIAAADHVRKEIRRERRCRVAVVAIEVVYRKRHVTLRYARCRRAVVTRAAIAGNAGVTKRGGLPCERRVACVTFLCGDDVRCGFSGSCYAVVTATARTANVSVIDAYHRYPRRRCMTRIASIVADDMRCAFARCNRAVVARQASTDHLRVIDASSGPPDGRAMTKFAIVAGSDMRGVFARCR